MMKYRQDFKQLQDLYKEIHSKAFLIISIKAISENDQKSCSLLCRQSYLMSTLHTVVGLLLLIKLGCCICHQSNSQKTYRIIYQLFKTTLIRLFCFDYLFMCKSYGTPQPQCGQLFYCDGSCSSSGTVWGTGIFASGSNIYMAAKHQGFLPGYFRKINCPGISAYNGATKNGITTNNYGKNGSSFILTKSSQTEIQCANCQHKFGQVFSIIQQGSLNGAYIGVKAYFYYENSVNSWIYAYCKKCYQTKIKLKLLKNLAPELAEQLQKQLQQLKSSKEKLQKTVQQLSKGKLKQLTQANEYLQIQVQQLKITKIEIQKRLNNLITEKQNLLKQFKQLVQDKSSLITKVQQLDDANESLELKVQQLTQAKVQNINSIAVLQSKVLQLIHALKINVNFISKEREIPQFQQVRNQFLLPLRSSLSELQKYFFDFVEAYHQIQDIRNSQVSAFRDSQEFHKTNLQKIYTMKSTWSERFQILNQRYKNSMLQKSKINYSFLINLMQNLCKNSETETLFTESSIKVQYKPNQLTANTKDIENNLQEYLVKSLEALTKISCFINISKQKAMGLLLSTERVKRLKEEQVFLINLLNSQGRQVQKIMDQHNKMLQRQKNLSDMGTRFAKQSLVEVKQVWKYLMQNK